MATLSNPLAGDTYSLRIYKRLIANPMIEWANTYEIRNTVGGQSVDEFSSLVDLFVNNEAAIHKNVVGYTRAVLSTWVEDGQPYNPNTFYSKDVSSVSGALGAGTEIASLHNCLQVNRDVEFGRNGRALFRGIIEEGMINSDSGSPRLTETAFNLTRLSVEAFYSSLQVGMPLLGFTQVMVAKNSLGIFNSRDITGFTLNRRVVVKKFNNRYFDRA